MVQCMQKGEVMSKLLFGEVEGEFTVDEMIGVLKWIELNERLTYEPYMKLLLEAQDDGFGETTVASCRETLWSN